jgi:zinc transporter
MDAKPPLPPCHGLIAAWSLAPGRAPRALAAEDVPAALAAGALWLHFDLIDARARAFLAALPLPEAARHTLIDPEEAVRLDATAEVAHGCIPDTHYDAEGHAAPPIGLLHLALTERLLVTARRHPLRGVHRALAAPEAESGAAALAAVLREILGDFARQLGQTDVRLARLEDRMLAGRADPRAGETLGTLQRELLRQSRHLEPLAEALVELADFAPAWMADDPLARERRRASHLVRTIRALASRARIAQDQQAARATNETNRRLLVLSVISAAMLPASLVAGIFGMNVGGVPGVGEGLAWGFPMAMGLIGASVVGVLAALRAFRLL